MAEQLGQKISELEAASALDGTELLVTVQGGQTKKSTAAAVETLVKTGLSKTDVGLGNVDNVRQYSAQNPPPTPSAADVGAVPISRTVNGKALSADISLSASDVGAIPSADKGVAGGVAELDENGRIPTAQLPSYVDDVQEYASMSAFPATGESGKIYVALDTNLTYRWSGTAYVEISPSLALGETSSTAYRGDRGKTAYDFSQTPYTSDPAMDGTASPGSSGAWARGDHVHPTDTSRQAVLTWDDAPTAGSTNPVKSGGIYDAILKLYPTDTVSGSPANFPDGADGIPVVDLTVEIVPVQDGSGDPTPENIRPISGWTGLTLSHSGADTSDPEELAVSWEDEAGTVYGGTLDLTTGVLTVTKGIVDFGNLTWNKSQGSSISWASVVSGPLTAVKRPESNSVPVDAICSEYKATPASGSHSDYEIYYNMTSGSAHFGLYNSNFAELTTSEIQTALTGVKMVFALKTPVTYQLTPVQVRTLLGENNIWADTGAVTVTYRANISDYLAKKLPSTLSTLSMSRPSLTMGDVESEEVNGQEEMEDER